MDHKSSTTAGAAPVVIEATTHLKEVNREPKDDVEKHRKDTNDVMEILQGLAGRLQKIEEKMDLLISSLSVKAEAENMSIDESSFGQEYDESGNRFLRFSDDRDHRFLFGPGRGQQAYDRSGRGQETYYSLSRFNNGVGEYSDDRFGPFYNGRGRGLHVGGRFAGGRCGGQGFCGHC